MMAQDMIQMLMSATPNELAQIRKLLRVSDEEYNCQKLGGKGGEIPRNLADVWNRTGKKDECLGK